MFKDLCSICFCNHIRARLSGLMSKACSGSVTNLLMYFLLKVGVADLGPNTLTQFEIVHK